MSTGQWKPSSPALSAGDLASSPLVVVHYWAEWDLTDRKMDKVLESLRIEFGDRICFRSYDVDVPDTHGFVQGIENIPALGCFIRGKWVKSVIGMRSADQLRQQFTEWLKLLSSHAGQPVKKSRQFWKS